MKRYLYAGLVALGVCAGPVHAGDFEKILGGIIVGAIVHDMLDNRNTVIIDRPVPRVVYPAPRDRYNHGYVDGYVDGWNDRGSYDRRARERVCETVSRRYHRYTEISEYNCYGELIDVYTVRN